MAGGVASTVMGVVRTASIGGVVTLTAVDAVAVAGSGIVAPGVVDVTEGI